MTLAPIWRRRRDSNYKGWENSDKHSTLEPLEFGPFIIRDKLFETAINALRGKHRGNLRGRFAGIPGSIPDISSRHR